MEHDRKRCEQGAFLADRRAAMSMKNLSILQIAVSSPCARSLMK